MEYSPQDEILIAEKWQELQDACNRHKVCRREGDWDFIKRAFFLAKEAHKGVRRRSGEPYIIHPIEVALIAVREIGLGKKSVVAALLHDVVEDTEYTVEDIERIFSPKIASMVDGLTKMAGVFNADSTEQAEYFRKVLLTLSDDVRVIIIKIADRLHNMRTLGAMPHHKQIKITSETIYLFVPLAYRLGLHAIKSELEDLCMRYRFPEEYAEIKRKIDDTETERQEYIEKFMAPIRAVLDRNKFQYEMTARVKSIYSIWNKMRRKSIPFEEVYDLFAIRIVFKALPFPSEKTQCWQIYSCVTDIYTPKPDRLRDWISIPKSNGYEALHFTLMGPDGHWIEVQIRSKRMDEIAERGLAAHWKYKDGNKSAANANIRELDKWVRDIKEILDNPEPNALDFLDTIKLNLLSREIYVFTPNGDLKELPKGASALDFAFALHTKIGMRAQAARINHEFVPLNTILESGVQVEIICSEEDTIKPEWKQIVTTTKARSKIQSWINKQRREKSVPGQKKLEEFVRKCGYTLNNDIMVNLMNGFKANSKEDIFIMVEDGEIPLNNKTRNMLNVRAKGGILGFLHLNQINLNPLAKKKEKPEKKDKAALLSEAHAEEERKKANRTSTIELSGIDGRGLLNTITRVICDTCTANIVNIHLECKDGLFKGYITLDTGDTKQIQTMCASLKKIHEIEKAVKI